MIEFMKNTFYLSVSAALLFVTQFTTACADGQTASTWIEKSSIAVVKVHTSWELDRWSNAEQIFRKAENTLLQSGAPEGAWQYEKLAHFANLMETCDILAITAEPLAAQVTDKENRVYALASLISVYRSPIRVRIDGVRDGLRIARTRSGIQDIRTAADEMLKMLDDYDQTVITPRLRELELLQKTIGTPPNN